LDDKAMSVARLALRQQRNSLLPVGRLPTELLRIIFAFSSETDRAWTEEGPTTKIGWLTVTHVCQRWRYVALEHPGLWTHICVHALGPGWANAFAERAR
ncbi:hypothetical protein FA95DRAFT_1477606, partial [Auriscalpium vulgare]